MYKLSLILFLLFSIHVMGQDTYVKEYYDNGTKEEEGWAKEGIKIKYWKYYYEDGKT